MRTIHVCVGGVGGNPREDSMMLDLRRDPDNDFGANAVAIVRGRERMQDGHVTKGTAKFVVKEMDDGVPLVGRAVMKRRYILIGTAEIWAQLNQ